MTKLSDDLLLIYQFELERGNEVDYIAEPAGSACPYAVVFKRPMQKAAIEAELKLPDSVSYWESRDPHYPIEAGYSSNVSRHSVAGPLPQ